MLHDVEVLFSVDRFRRIVNVILCETEPVVRGGECIRMPVRVVKDVTTEPVNVYEELQPTFSVQGHELHQLADELAAIGVYPKRLPEATDHHLADIRHSRDFLESVVDRLVKRK